MSNLRIFGLLFGILFIAASLIVYRGPRWRRTNFIFGAIIGLGLLVVSLNPDILNTMRNLLSMGNPECGRLLVLLIGSNIFLWVVIFYIKSRHDFLSYKFDSLVMNNLDENIKSISQNIVAADIGVVIPAYNEMENLKNLLLRIPSQIDNKRIVVVVVDDGSSDDTLVVVKNMGFPVIKNPINQGGGASLRVGYKIISQAKIPICVTMDADGQHNPAEIEKLIEPILKNNADVVIGSRKLGSEESVDFIRKIGLVICNKILSGLLGFKITDCSNGYRAFKTNIFPKLNLLENQYHTTEFILEVIKKKFLLQEVPVTVLKRKYGQSKKGGILKYGLNFFLVIFNTWWRK